MTAVVRGPVRVNVRAVAHGGAGVGEAADTAGPVWFVPGALPGEVVEAHEQVRRPRYVRGQLVRVLEPSPIRVTPPCPLAGVCGGCTWQHVAPQEQPALKLSIVADQLRKLTGARPDLPRMAGTGSASGYRRRARMHYARDGSSLRLGFYAPESHDIVDVQRCMVLTPTLDQALQRLRAVADRLPARGEVLGLANDETAVLGLPGVRPEPTTMQALRALLDDRLVGIELRGGRRAAAVGQTVLELDGVAGLVPMRASPFVFTQPQAEVSAALVRHVATAARCDGKRVLELYAGAGNFTRALAKTATRVWASDTDREAVELLRQLAAAHHLPINAKRQSATRLLPRLADADRTYPVVVLDPPRGGLGQAASRALAQVATERVVYVSCDPATLARDLEVLVEAKLDLVDLAVFDLMPMTPEVEVVATLVRREVR